MFRFKFVTSGTLSVIINLACGVGQIQAGWAQHDYGHLSVFRSSRWNHRVQIFLLNFIKVLSSVVLCEVNAAFCRSFAGYWRATTEDHVKHRFSTNFWLNEIQ